MAKLLKQLGFGYKKSSVNSNAIYSNQDHGKKSNGTNDDLVSSQTQNRDKGGLIKTSFKRSHTTATCNAVADNTIQPDKLGNEQPNLFSVDEPVKPKSRLFLLGLPSTAKISSCDKDDSEKRLSRSESTTRCWGRRDDSKNLSKRKSHESVSKIQTEVENNDNSVVILQDYSDPVDVKSQKPEKQTINKKLVQEDDYIEPYTAENSSKLRSSDNEISIVNPKDNLNSSLSSSHGGSENSSIGSQTPRSGKIKRRHSSETVRASSATSSPANTLQYTKPRRSSSAHRSISSDTVHSAVTCRQRHIYETAFDSAVKHDKKLGELEDLANHPILRNDSPLITPKTTPKLPLRVITSRDVSNPGFLTPKERRKVTLIREGGKRYPSELLSHSRMKENSPKIRTEQVKALVHTPPRSANSTPLLSHRTKQIDIIASSAKSTPTHYSSVSKVTVQVPVKPLSDLSISTNPSNSFIPSSLSRPSTSSEFSQSLDTTSSDQSILSESKILESDETENQIKEENEEIEERTTDVIKEIDPRPPEDYDPPWEFTNKKLLNLSLLPHIESTEVQKNNDNTENNESNNENKPVLNFELSKPPRPTLSLGLKQINSDSGAPNKLGLTLNFNSQSPKRKRKLQLNFGCAALSVVGEKVDVTIPLERQGWYHGSISRTDAENLLRVLKEGSYLIRNCESNKQDYSLSLKSARGFMHMKIVNTEGKFILGQFSKPFPSIPEMIQHYTLNKLPIKGAEHMSLLYPVIDQLL